MSYSHVNQPTNLYVEKSIAEKIAWIRKDHFVFYDKARKCLEELEYLFDQLNYMENTTFPSDLESMSIVGEPGTGKTTIELKFLQTHSPEHHPSFEGYPVAYCMLKDSITGLKGLYSSLLYAYGHPYADQEAIQHYKITVDQLEEALIFTAKKAGTKLMFIDEFQHAKGRNQQSILNQLKRTMLVSRVPFVPVGTPEMLSVLKLDPQLASRCPVREYSRLTLWEYNNEFRSFLAGYETFLPFSEPSGLSSRELSYKIFQKTKFRRTDNNSSNVVNAGLTSLREITRFLKKVAITALKNNHPRILEEDIRETSY